MKHFENNVNDGMSRTDSIETLIDLTSCIAVNALIVAGGEAEANEKDAGAWWAMIALAEAALESYPEDVRAKGYQVVNENTNRELVEQARRKEAFPLMKKTGGYVILTVESEQKTIEFDDETGEVWDE